MGDNKNVAATRLTELLTTRGTRPALGVYQVAGFPNLGDSASVARMLAVYGGADFIEIGVPFSDPVLDGPDISEAHRRALRQGVQTADVMHVVREAAQYAPVVVMTYFAPVARYGLRRFAKDLARAGAAGAMIPDLPLDEADEWLAAAEDFGLHAPQLASRRSSDLRLRRVTRDTTGWVYAPAADAPTGHQGDINVEALRVFCQRLRAIDPAEPATPIVSGIGLSTPQRAAAVAPYVEGVAIGSPLIRPLLEQPDWRGMYAAVEITSAFADALPRTSATSHAVRL